MIGVMQCIQILRRYRRSCESPHPLLPLHCVSSYVQEPALLRIWKQQLCHHKLLRNYDARFSNSKRHADDKGMPSLPWRLVSNGYNTTCFQAIQMLEVLVARLKEATAPSTQCPGRAAHHSLRPADQLSQRCCWIRFFVSSEK